MGVVTNTISTFVLAIGRSPFTFPNASNRFSRRPGPESTRLIGVLVASNLKDYVKISKIDQIAKLKKNLTSSMSQW